MKHIKDIKQTKCLYCDCGVKPFLYKGRKYHWDQFKDEEVRELCPNHIGQYFADDKTGKLITEPASKSRGKRTPPTITRFKDGKPVETFVITAKSLKEFLGK